jgi:hypothetical protein
MSTIKSKPEAAVDFERIIGTEAPDGLPPLPQPEPVDLIAGGEAVFMHAIAGEQERQEALLDPAERVSLGEA